MILFTWIIPFTCAFALLFHQILKLFMQEVEKTESVLLISNVLL